MHKKYVAVGALLLAAPRAAGAAQPELAWSSYYGGTSDEFIGDVAVDAMGNIYVVGRTSSATGISAGGVHDGTLNGQTDAFLVKLDPAGKRLWGFYFGGASADSGLSVAVRDDKLVIGGSTASISGIATPGTFQPNFVGTNIGFVAVFTAAGQQVWGTYLGGNDGTAVNSLAFDDMGRVYACGASTANANFANGASHQPTNAGLGDGFLLLLDTAGKLVWGTYYGGTENERCDDIHHRAGVGVFLSGETSSTTGIATLGVKGPGKEGFIARFYANGIREWGRYLGGNAQDDAVTTELHPNGGLALIMSARSGSLSTDGSVPGGNDDTLIARIDDDGAVTWATYFGGNAQEVAGGLAVGPDGQIYALAVTSSKNLATPGAYQSVLLGGRDGVLHQVSPAGVHGWTSYFGGNSIDDALTAGVYGGGLIVVGNTKSNTNVAALNAHQLTIGGAQDGLIAKFIPQVQPQPDGAPCDDGKNCQSGLCVDGVCCDAACGDGDPNDCQACSAAEGAAKDGTCGPKAKNTECRPAMGVCDAAEACNGVALVCPPDGPAPDGTDCPDGVCSAGVCAPPEASSSTTDPSDATTDPSDATTVGDATSAGTDGTTTGGGGPQTTTTTGGPGGTSGGPGGTGDASTLTAGDTSASSATPTEGGGPDDDPGDTTGFTSLTGFTSTGAPQDGDGCGCTSASTPGLAGLLLGLLARRRRRRASGIS